MPCGVCVVVVWSKNNQRIWGNGTCRAIRRTMTCSSSRRSSGSRLHGLMPLSDPVCLLLNLAYELRTENAVGFVQGDSCLNPHTGSFFCSVHNFRVLPSFDVVLVRAASSTCTTSPKYRFSASLKQSLPSVRSFPSSGFSVFSV